MAKPIPRLSINAIDALRVLEETLAVRDGEPLEPQRIRAALRVLLPLCPKRWPLDRFWDTVNFGSFLGRYQNLNASLNGIHRQIGLPYGWKAPG